MQKLAQDFGNVGVIRRFCDNPECRSQIALCWKGRYGEYCSNGCLKTAEKLNKKKHSGEKKMRNNDDEEIFPLSASPAVDEEDDTEEEEEEQEDEEEDDTTSDDETEEEEEEAPIQAKPTNKGAKPSKKVAAKPAAKKAAKPAAKSAKPAKKAASSNGNGRALSFERDAVIKTTDTFKSCRTMQGDGISSQRAKVIKSGMTVDKYLEALKKNDLPPGLGTLQALAKAGHVTVK